MPTYKYVGDTPKTLDHTTPPIPLLNPGDAVTVAETLDSPEFEPVSTPKAAKAAATPPQEP